MSRYRKPALAAAFAGLVAFAAPAFAADMGSDDTLSTAAGDMKIHAFHHASLSLSWGGTTVLVDPAPMMGGAPAADPSAEFKSAAANPDLILITHEHPDHFNPDILFAVAGDKTTIVAPQDVVDKLPEGLKGKAKALANGETAMLANVSIMAVPAYNSTEDRTKFHPKGRGDNGYVLTIGDKHVYIAGDTEDTPEMRALTGIDAAFVPMNLPYTMDVQHAADAVKAFRPKVVYPYHYSGSDLEAFKEAVGDAAEVRLLKWY